MNKKLNEEQYKNIEKELRESPFVILQTEKVSYFYGNKILLLIYLFKLIDKIEDTNV